MTGNHPDFTKQGFSTRAIHAGQEPEPATGAVNVPIYASSTYVQEEIGKHKGYEYSRVSNPTRDRLETNLAALEGGVAAKVFASGMAAINAVATMLKAGDHVVAGHNLYGGTPRLFSQVLVNFGLTFTYVDTSDLDAVKKALQPNTRLVFLETPTNPLMELCDIRAVSDIAHRHGAEVAVDNTFMSPFFQRPIEFAAASKTRNPRTCSISKRWRPHSLSTPCRKPRCWPWTITANSARSCQPMEAIARRCLCGSARLVSNWERWPLNSRPKGQILREVLEELLAVIASKSNALRGSHKVKGR